MGAAAALYATTGVTAMYRLHPLGVWTEWDWARFPLFVIQRLIICVAALIDICQYFDRHWSAHRLIFISTLIDMCHVSTFTYTFQRLNRY